MESSSGRLRWADLLLFLLLPSYSSCSQATHLDVRKMLFVKERDVTWAEIVAVAQSFAGLEKLELPKVGLPD